MMLQVCNKTGLAFGGAKKGKRSILCTHIKSKNYMAEEMVT